jgi:amino acid transporter
MPDGSSASPSSNRRVTEVVVLTTAMLTFISFWRAAAIVLCDMASTMFYVAGIVEQAVGPAAPWFILLVMLFSSAVLAMYVEASIMFVRGGVYRVVKEAMGSSLAKISVSTLMFGFVLTGPISSVSAGQYLVGLFNSWLGAAGAQTLLPANATSVIFALAVTAYFWWQNIKGIEESSDKALKIMQMTGVMGLVLLVWGGYTIWARGASLPPMTPRFTEEGLGWLGHFDWAKSLGAFGICIAVGHSFLGMTGAETLAQVYREMEAPKVKNLKRAAVLIFLFAAVMTSFSAFLGVMILPTEVRAEYIDNLLAGVALALEGPMWARQIFHALIVLVGVMILAGAVNTSIVGANGVMARLAEDGVLADWFRWLHPRFGTTHRMINLLVILQVITIFACGGDVYVLGEAYAFGVIWSFIFMAMAVVVLRFTRPEASGTEAGEDSFRVPPSLRIGDKAVPLGLFLILAVLLMAGCLNLVTKKLATIWGGAFSLGFYVLILVSEKINERQRKRREDAPREKLNLRKERELDGAGKMLGKSDKVLVALRDPKNMYPLLEVLESVDTDETDVIVLHSRPSPRMMTGEVKSIGPNEELLFTNVIAIAEKQGKTVSPLLVVSNDPAYAVAQAAHALGVEQIVMGRSTKIGAEDQIERLAMTLGAMEGRQIHTSVRVRVVWGEGMQMAAEI